jgi:hypothetical protein
MGTIGALVGLGVAGTLATHPTMLVDLATGVGLLLLVAAGLGVLLAARVWLLDGWRPIHTVHALGAGLAWIVMAFLMTPAEGVLPMILGATLLGTGLGGLVTTGRLGAPEATRPRGA